MRLLIIDTSSVVSVAAVSVDEAGAADVVSRFVGTDTHRHAEDLTPAVARALAEAGWDRPDAVLVGEGPGPFTGLRVGLATAQTLAFAWDVPVLGLCSLDGLAHEVAARHHEPFLATLDARRKEVYWAAYDADGVRTDGPHVGKVAALPELAVAGAGVAARSDEIREQGTRVLEGTQEMVVDAAELGLAWLAAGAPRTAPVARYLRESDAVVPRSMARTGEPGSAGDGGTAGRAR